jgi:hypothetical protein
MNRPLKAGDEVNNDAVDIGLDRVVVAPSYGRRESRFQGINFRMSETIFGGIRVCVARADSRHDMSALLPEHSGKELNEIIV